MRKSQESNNVVAWLIICLLVGASLSLVNLSKSGFTMGSTRNLRIGPLNEEGPWPECMGMDGQDCAALIKSHAPSVKIVFMKSSDFVTDTQNRRVTISVNRAGEVTEVPARG